MLIESGKNVLYLTWTMMPSKPWKHVYSIFKLASPLKPTNIKHLLSTIKPQVCPLTNKPLSLDLNHLNIDRRQKKERLFGKDLHTITYCKGSSLQQTISIILAFLFLHYSHSCRTATVNASSRIMAVCRVYEVGIYLECC